MCGLVLDAGGGPVACFGDQGGESFASWVWEGGEAVPVAERVFGELDALPEVGGGVVEVEADGVVGEVFGLHADLAEEEPRVDDGGHDDHEEPEGGELDDEAAQGLVLGLAGFVGENHEQDHEEGDDQPGGEAVRELEVVVHLESEGWVGHDDDGEEQSQDHV